jgi:tRNA U34 5-carboxymethylaminomethyl modifying GTPase MnmE/TrmE
VIESIGVGKSLEKMQQADIVVYMFDVGDEVEEVVLRKKEVETGAGQDEVRAGKGGQGVAGKGGDDWRTARPGEGSQEADLAGDVRTSAARSGVGTGVDDQRVVGQEMGTGKHKRFLWVGNKVDAIGEEAARRKFGAMPDTIFISAKEGRQVDLLKQRLVDQVLQGSVQTEGTIVTNARHYHALQQVAESLAAIHKGLDERLPGDLLALDIRHCLHYLGEITGEITSEDRLDYIFSKFCIGK